MQLSLKDKAFLFGKYMTSILIKHGYSLVIYGN